MAIPIVQGTPFDAGVPAPLFASAGVVSRLSSTRYRVSADGQRFLLNTLREGDKAATTTSLQIVLNWTAALKQ